MPSRHAPPTLHRLLSFGANRSSPTYHAHPMFPPHAEGLGKATSSQHALIFLSVLYCHTKGMLGCFHERKMPLFQNGAKCRG